MHISVSLKTKRKVSNKLSSRKFLWQCIKIIHLNIKSNVLGRWYECEAQRNKWYWFQPHGNLHRGTPEGSQRSWTRTYRWIGKINLFIFLKILSICPKSFCDLPILSKHDELFVDLSIQCCYRTEVHMIPSKYIHNDSLCLIFSTLHYKQQEFLYAHWYQVNLQHWMAIWN